MINRVIVKLLGETIGMMMVVGVCIAHTPSNLAPPAILQSHINNSGSDTHGVFELNMAAGQSNRQVNIAELGIAPNGPANAIGAVSQPGNGNSSATTGPLIAVSQITGRSFNNVRGALSVNQVSGNNNRQVNGLAILKAKSGEAKITTETDFLNNTVAHPVSPAQLKKSDKSKVLIANIDKTAFANASGMIQVNQIAGNNNLITNTMSIQIVH